MRTKLILGAIGALGLLWVHVAQALTVDLDAETIAVTKYASETLSGASGSVTTVDGTSYYHIQDNTTDFIVTRTLQTDGGGDDIGVRFIFTNLVFVGTANDASVLHGEQRPHCEAVGDGW